MFCPFLLGQPWCLYLSICLSVCPSIHPFTYPFIHLSTHLPTTFEYYKYQRYPSTDSWVFTQLLIFCKWPKKDQSSSSPSSSLISVASPGSSSSSQQGIQLGVPTLHKESTFFPCAQPSRYLHPWKKVPFTIGSSTEQAAQLGSGGRCPNFPAF